VDYDDFVRALGTKDAALAGEVGRLRTLEHVLDWMKGRGIDLAGLDVVQQDEYSHDALIPLGQDGRYLVVGMT
jgi:hypothetical protein